MSPLLKKFAVQLSVNDTPHFQNNPRYYWIDEIEDITLFSKIIALPERDIDLLTMLSEEGFSQHEIATFRGVAPAAICKKIKN